MLWDISSRACHTAEPRGETMVEESDKWQDAQLMQTPPGTARLMFVFFKKANVVIK